MGNLYERIVLLCEKKEVRPGRLCDDLGLSRGLITDLKMGRKKGVNADTAQKIAGYLGVSVEYLLGSDMDDDLCNNTLSGAPDILDKVDVAFYGDFKELNEEEKETVRDMVRLMRQRRAEKQRL